MFDKVKDQKRKKETEKELSLSTADSSPQMLTLGRANLGQSWKLGPQFRFSVMVTGTQAF